MAAKGCLDRALEGRSRSSGTISSTGNELVKALLSDQSQAGCGEHWIGLGQPFGPLLGLVNSMTSHRKILKQKYPDCWQWISLAERFPGDLTENEANSLFQLARSRTPSIDPLIVELGVSGAKTSLLFAAGLRGKTRPRVFSFRRDDARCDTADNPDECAFHRNGQQIYWWHGVKATFSHSTEAFASWKDCIDILFIRASEDYGSLQGDLSRWSPFVKRSGLVVLHASSPDLSALSRAMAEDLRAPRYGDLRRIDGLVWAEKQSLDSRITTVKDTTVNQIDLSAREQEMKRLSNELEQLRNMVDSLIEVMLRPKTIPSLGKAGLPYPDPPQIEHLEDSTRIAIGKLQDYLRRASKELLQNRHTIEALHRSWSWKLTAPLRSGVQAFRAIAGLLRSLSSGSPYARMQGLVQWMRFGRGIRASGLLDERYYQENHPGVPWAQASSSLHFFVCGASEGDKPNELFDTKFYLGRYPDVAHSGMNPLVHYLKHGAYEGRDPHPHFDSSFYLEQNPDVREAQLNPLAHYLAPGIAEGRDPNPWFDTSEYLEQNPDVVDFMLNPLTHQAWANQTACSR